jgi:hypothetical protein
MFFVAFSCHMIYLFFLKFQLRFRKALEKKTSHASEGTLPTAPFISADPAAVTTNGTSADPETSTPDGTAASISCPTILSHHAKNITMLPGNSLSYSISCQSYMNKCTERDFKCLKNFYVKDSSTYDEYAEEDDFLEPTPEKSRKVVSRKETHCKLQGASGINARFVTQM